jgi:hypothetical protein
MSWKGLACIWTDLVNKLTIYYSFILSNFNYCPLVWHFCGGNNTKKLEYIQERALRFIYNDQNSDYDQLLPSCSYPKDFHCVLISKRVKIIFVIH